MSFGAGHAQDMNNRMKQNRSQRASNREKFKEGNRDNIYSETEAPRTRLEFKTPSDEELRVIKKQIQKQAKTQRIKERIIYGIGIICGLAAITKMISWMQ